MTALVVRFVSAFNAADLEGAAGVFAADANVSDCDYANQAVVEAKGGAAIRSWLAQRFADHDRLVIRSVFNMNPDADRVVGVEFALRSSDTLARLGAPDGVVPQGIAKVGIDSPGERIVTFANGPYGANPGDVRRICSPQQGVIAPDTLIDGYLIGLPDPTCDQLGNPECAKILDLVKTKGLDTAAGRDLIADCSLNKAECERFTGLPAREGFSKQNGIAEVVGLAEAAMLARWPGLDPAAIVGIGLYAESETGWMDANGKHLRTRSAPYTLVVFDFADGSRHVAGVVCSTGECWAHGPDDPNASPPVDVVSSAGQEPSPSPS